MWMVDVRSSDCLAFPDTQSSCRLYRRRAIRSWCRVSQNGNFAIEEVNSNINRSSLDPKFCVHISISFANLDVFRYDQIYSQTLEVEKRCHRCEDWKEDSKLKSWLAACQGHMRFADDEDFTASCLFRSFVAQRLFRQKPRTLHYVCMAVCIHNTCGVLSPTNLVHDVCWLCCRGASMYRWI